MLWTAAFAVSTLVGAIGWGTEFARFKAYMPAFLHGAFAAGDGRGDAFRLVDAHAAVLVPERLAGIRKSFDEWLGSDSFSGSRLFRARLPILVQRA